MQHYKALQRADGKWDYTVTWKDRSLPVGYCAGWTDWGIDIAKMHPAANALAVSLKAKYHVHGHETAEDACACYKQYLLDQSLTLGIESDFAQFKCQVCGEWTMLRASVGRWYHFELCPKHNNRESIETLFTIDESWES